MVGRYGAAMKHLVTRVLSLAACSLSLVSCGGDSHEALAKDSVGLFTEVAIVIEGVTDKASAETAKGKIDALAARGHALQERAEALGAPDEAKGKALEASYEKSMMEAQQRMMKAMMALSSKPEVMAMLQDSLAKLQLGR